MPREKRPPEVQKMFDNLNSANRELKQAIIRFTAIEQTIGLREGHRAEIRRRLLSVHDESDRFLDNLER